MISFFPPFPSFARAEGGEERLVGRRDPGLFLVKARVGAFKRGTKVKFGGWLRNNIRGIFWVGVGRLGGIIASCFCSFDILSRTVSSAQERSGKREWGGGSGRFDQGVSDGLSDFS
jgi:hypothetical protein